MGCKSLELHGTQLFFASSEIIEMHRIIYMCQVYQYEFKKF